MGIFQRSILAATLRVVSTFTIFASVLALPWAAHATIPSAAGVELGGNGSLLVTDPTLNAFGLGAGEQASVFLTMWTDHKIAGKFRFETISMHEESVQKAETDYIIPGSSLKSMSQSWNTISFGVTGGIPMQGQTFFWEALVGYAIGAPSTVTVTMNTPGTGLIDTTQSTSSGFILSGGGGIKRVFSQKITGICSLRTQILMAPTYSGSPLNGKTFIAMPISFNVGVEIPFAF